MNSKQRVFQTARKGMVFLKCSIKLKTKQTQTTLNQVNPLTCATNYDYPFVI